MTDRETKQYRRRDQRPDDPYALADSLGLVYAGDRDVCYGGAFFNLSTFHWDYVRCVQVTDLDSACGARGMVLVEALTVYVESSDLEAEAEADLSAEGRRALESGGIVAKYLAEADEDTRKRMLVESALSYGPYDPAQPSHMRGDRPQSETLQTEPADEYFGPMVSSEGCRADRRVLADNVLSYIRARWLPRIVD